MPVNTTKQTMCVNAFKLKNTKIILYFSSLRTGKLRVAIEMAAYPT